jgi:hypothetical protein
MRLEVDFAKEFTGISSSKRELFFAGRFGIHVILKADSGTLNMQAIGTFGV